MTATPPDVPWTEPPTPPPPTLDRDTYLRVVAIQAAALACSRGTNNGANTLPWLAAGAYKFLTGGPE